MMEKEYWTSIGFNPANESWTETEDSRITKIGKFLRKIRIDELP